MSTHPPRLEGTECEPRVSEERVDYSGAWVPNLLECLACGSLLTTFGDPFLVLSLELYVRMVKKTITKMRSNMCQMTNSLAFWPPPLTGCARLRLGQAQERRA